MRWKNWSYTIKGAILFVIIGIIIEIIIFSIFGISELKTGPPGDINLKQIIDGLPYVIALGIFPSIVILFIIGSIVGWIYGKIKGGKK